MKPSNPDVSDTIKFELEDEIYLQMDKLLALCSLQAIVEHNGHEIAGSIRTNYAAVLEEQAIRLRKLLDKVFDIQSRS